MSDEMAIRQLITRWLDAMVACDIYGVLAHHDPDIVLFDVPPPHTGVRGLDAYRDTWPPFFDFLRSGAIFELLELDVTAGADVAFAYGLLRCATQESLTSDPDARLRLTVGLRHRDGDWYVTHEHHSFCMTE
ncbi:YybH family protein [Mycolicibacterium baixiangningiae]|uniref:YybH family protein n=1 Tax=Mycolicibacterium baixiangningiae TaxID=2761578 RepID=UPI0018D1B0A2|nr:nuclear transport factor 2 family protein [Mycolicibacterium baixiangningiae]